MVKIIDFSSFNRSSGVQRARTNFVRPNESRNISRRTTGQTPPLNRLQYLKAGVSGIVSIMRDELDPEAKSLWEVNSNAQVWAAMSKEGACELLEKLRREKYRSFDLGV